MSNSRHAHRHRPRCEITGRMRDANGAITNGAYVYHATKGWRRIAPNPGPGRLRRGHLIAQANRRVGL